MVAEAIVDEALAQCPGVTKCILYKRSGTDINWVEGRDMWWHDLMAEINATRIRRARTHECRRSLYILLHKRETGSAQGCASYPRWIFTALCHDHQIGLRLRENETFWCSADIGWVTGHSYTVYGPLCMGFTSVLLEGIPTYPG